MSIQVYDGLGIKDWINSMNWLLLNCKDSDERTWHDGHTDISPRYETVVRQIILNRPDEHTRRTLNALTNHVMDFDGIRVGDLDEVRRGADSSIKGSVLFKEASPICLVASFGTKLPIASILIQSIPIDNVIDKSSLKP